MSKSSEEQRLRTPRKLKTPAYKRGKFQKRIKHPGPKLSSSWMILRHSFGIFKRNPLLFGGILAIYTLLSLVLVRGFTSSAQLTDSKILLQSGHTGAFNVSTGLLGNLFSAAGSAAPAGATYQSVLFVLISLVIIWALRYCYGKRVRPAPLKAAFYKSMSQLVPFLIVLVVISLQLIPLLLGTSLYSFVVGGGIAVNPLEQLLSLGILLLSVVWSLYMISSSLFALYIVTLPDITPMQALRSAKELVQFRRWTVMRKIVFLPFILFVAVSAVMLPSVLLLTGVAEWVFFVLSLALLIVAHSYFYNLYRELT